MMHDARARAERIMHRALVALAALDDLLAAAGVSPSRLAWLRAASTSPAATHF
jgi:hypothetical protein